MPAMIPDNGGAPDANAIPKHSGRATKNTTNPEGRFCLMSAKNDDLFFIIEFNYNRLFEIFA
ncbi:hypothetical protein GCM10010992_10320 [Cloacibacterium rupense]|uniref:Uncharacterized protein n=1 Tax=Cloacibacterium rupense TaxID=517423 RepID=A0ABQ2NIW5_9FLAO|nr:hypothetical protein GCM10010992_10320 [Cloacibacterium rupense]